MLGESGGSTAVLLRILVSPRRETFGMTVVHPTRARSTSLAPAALEARARATRHSSKRMTQREPRDHQQGAGSACGYQGVDVRRSVEPRAEVVEPRHETLLREAQKLRKAIVCAWQGSCTRPFLRRSPTSGLEEDRAAHRGALGGSELGTVDGAELMAGTQAKYAR